jgi:integration host factor subunit beta
VTEAPRQNQVATEVLEMAEEREEPNLSGEEQEALTKSRLIDALALERGVPRRHAELVVNAVMQTMVEGLLEGKRVEIRGFGSFTVKEYPGYTGRNPRNGALVEVAEKRAVRFRVGKELRERLGAEDEAEGDAE